MNASNAYDLVVVGGTAGGLSVAVSSLRSGLGLVRVIESSNSLAFPELVGENQLDVGYGETVESIEKLDSDIIVTTNRMAYRTKACLVANRAALPGWAPGITVTQNERVHIDSLPEHVAEQDVLVVGVTDHAVELVADLAAKGAHVVMAAGGMDAGLLAPAADRALRRLERERRATLLYRSTPDQIAEVKGFPMAYFSDRRTPDLQFDHVVFASPRQTLAPDVVGTTDEALASGQVWFLGEPDSSAATHNDIAIPTAPGWNVGARIAEACFPAVDLDNVVSTVEQRRRHTSELSELRDEYYNATITYFEPTHSDLWVLRVRPDHGETNHKPGQYASLGLGYWEDRIDEAEDSNLGDKWGKLIRRSYSISSRMFDDNGYLFDESSSDELEFYIVLVPPTPDNVPALTPRLALKRPGDRIYLGPKVAGRYTLDAVTDPESTVIFFSTGTGEAPQNAMVVELLRKGHSGPIVSAVSVRKWADLGYSDQHRTLERRHQNYHYLPLPTREDDIAKQYMQDLIRNDVFEKRFGVGLDPERTNVFLCGNPSMIGLPEGKPGEEEFPETVGVVQLLTERGFRLDKRKQPGNVHYEEYW